jgi:transposase InsO family protein
MGRFDRSSSGLQRPGDQPGHLISHAAAPGRGSPGSPLAAHKPSCSFRGRETKGTRNPAFGALCRSGSPTDRGDPARREGLSRLGFDHVSPLERPPEDHRAPRPGPASAHLQYKKPKLLATGPNQIWSGDITKLKGPVKYSDYCLYVIADIFSRFVVGWIVAEREYAELAKELILEAVQQGSEPNQLTVHADRGSAIKSKSMAQLLVDLGVNKI